MRLKYQAQELICCQDIIRSEGCFLRCYYNCIQIDFIGLLFCLKDSNFNEALAKASDKGEFNFSKSAIMKKLEILLIAGAVVGLILVLLNTPLSSLIVSLFFVALGLLYFYLGFALFNGIRLRNIFKADSYKGVGPWRIALAIGTGIALSNLTMGYMYSILIFPMADTLLAFGIVLAVIMIVLALIKNTRDKEPFYRTIILRCLVFLVIAIAFLLIPGQIFEKLG